MPSGTVSARESSFIVKPAPGVGDRHPVDGEPVLWRRTTTGCQRKEDGAVLAGRLLVGEEPVAVGVVLLQSRATEVPPVR